MLHLISSLTKYFCLISLVTILTSCKHEEKYLSRQEVKRYNKKPVQNGLRINFNAPDNAFWVHGENIKLSKIIDTIRIDLMNSGGSYECWGKKFNNIHDLSENQVLKVVARAEGEYPPKLIISLRDINSNHTHLEQFNQSKNKVSKRIYPNIEFAEYYFDFSGQWKQKFPEEKQVDSSRIVEIMFFVNPGTFNWSGSLYISSIEAISLSDVPFEFPHPRNRKPIKSR